MNPKSHEVTIFTDGSSRGNPGPGGFGAIVIAPKIQNSKFMIQELGGREERTTNNRMELRAAIEALSFLHKSKIIHPKSVLICTDSSYLVNGITRWVHGWQENGWKTKEKKDVENRDLWEKLVEASRNKEIQWKQVGGHIGVAGNTRCDEIATSFADKKPTKLYSDVLENYSIKNVLDITHDVEAAKERSTSRARSSAKAYSYVSLVGGVIHTHKTWAECEQRVKGKSAKYKKALSAEEERTLIQKWNTVSQK